MSETSDNELVLAALESNFAFSSLQMGPTSLLGCLTCGTGKEQNQNPNPREDLCFQGLHIWQSKFSMRREAWPWATPLPVTKIFPDPSTILRHLLGLKEKDSSEKSLCCLHIVIYCICICCVQRRHATSLYMLASITFPLGQKNSKKKLLFAGMMLRQLKYLENVCRYECK